MSIKFVQLSRLQKILLGLGIAALLTPISFFAPFQMIFEGLENRALDYRFLLKETGPVEDSEVLIVLIDDDSVEPYGFRSPTSRALLGTVINQLNAKGALCIGLDFFFDREHLPAQDNPFKKALANSEIPVIMVPPSLEQFTENAELGFSEVKSDSRNIARVMTLNKPDEEFDRSFVTALLETCFPEMPELQIPGGGNSILINYFGPPSHIDDEEPTFMVVSAADLEFLPAEIIEEKIVLVGSGMEDLGDTFLTSFSTSASGFKIAFGVELHAIALEMIFQNRYLLFFPTMLLAAVMFIYLAGIGVTTLLLRPVFSIGISILLTIGWVFFSVNQFLSSDLLIPIVFPIFLAVFDFIGGQLILYLTESRYSKFLKSTFSRYIAPEVVQDLIDNPSQIELGGKARDVTILFTDLAGFTTISEKLNPQQVVSLLNDHLGGMADIIMERKGTIGAFIGDAVMAFYGAPVELEDHGYSACHSALEMQYVMIGLNEKWQEEGYPDVKMRVGIHTGNVIIGNIGSERRQDYTVIGDSVNLSSRLEGVNKYFGTGIIISGATLKLTDNKFITRELARIIVKGKTEPVPIHELAGEKNGHQPPADFYNRAENYLKGLEKYYGRDIEGAEKIFLRGSRELNDPPSVFMVRQCQEMKTKKLPDDWNGEVKMTGK